jgi:hypothetical protein
MGAIAGLWVPCVIIAHVFGLFCLILGPLRVWLNAQGGAKAFLARRRGSVPGKLPKAHGSDGEEDTLDVDAITAPAQQQEPPGPECSNSGTAAESGKQVVPGCKAAGHNVERLYLEWQSIYCSYAGAHGKINVLHDIWGKAAPGEMQVGQAVCDGR